MPKVTIDNKKGLVQGSGSGLVVSTSATLNGSATLANCVMKTEALTGDGACSITVPVTLVDSTGGASDITLAAGTQAGQVKHIIFVKDGGNAVLTIAASAFAGASNTYTFTDVGQSLSLLWAVDEDGTAIGWVQLSRGSGANAATAAVAGLAAATTV